MDLVDFGGVVMLEVRSPSVSSIHASDFAYSDGIEIMLLSLSGHIAPTEKFVSVLISAPAGKTELGRPERS